MELKVGFLFNGKYFNGNEQKFSKGVTDNLFITFDLYYSPVIDR